MIRVREVSGSMLTTGLLVYWNDSGARGAECNADKPVLFKFKFFFKTSDWRPRTKILTK